MTKYNEQFKRQIVDEYLAGNAGVKALGKRYGLSYTLVHRWVARYREHGVAGLSKKYSHYDEQFKLSVLQRMWRDELSYREVATLFNIRGDRTVATWVRLYHDGGIDALKPRRRGRPPSMKPEPDMKPEFPLQPDEARTPDTLSRDDLLKENEYLRAEVAYLKKLDALLRSKEQAAPKKKRQ